MPIKRRIAGGLLAAIGFMLSPLSWWNDAFVNLPIALVFAWLVSAPFGGDLKTRVFQAAVILGYWLTNVLGLILLHKGASQVVERTPPAGGGSFRKDILISIAYTLLIIVLIKFGVLKPFEAYFPARD
jgi:hypothetical protein